VSLSVLDVHGRRVRTLVDGERAPGAHSAIWNGTDQRGERAASGVYLIRLVAGELRATTRVVLQR
jgi:flagellar hook assembly protein FlgD